MLTCTNGVSPNHLLVNHIVYTCPLTKFEGRLNLLHEPDDVTVKWLESTATVCTRELNNLPVHPPYEMLAEGRFQLATATHDIIYSVGPQCAVMNMYSTVTVPYYPFGQVGHGPWTLHLLGSPRNIMSI